jgi:hypothetical protein
VRHFYAPITSLYDCNIEVDGKSSEHKQTSLTRSKEGTSSFLNAPSKSRIKGLLAAEHQPMCWLANDTVFYTTSL